MNDAARHALTGAAFLAVFALVGTALVVLTEQQSRERIAQNEREFLLDTFDLLVDPACYDNDPLADAIEVNAPDALGGAQPATVYRATHDGQAAAVVLTATAADGYSGAIRMLVGIDAGGTLTGVRVLSHRETPGLGDAIEASRSDWILGFSGRSLHDPTPGRWSVKKDGGEFDQFTGATITPRAVVEAIARALVYFERNREQLFAPHTILADDAVPTCRPNR
jgi:electron transport complex protein RnfG